MRKLLLPLLVFFLGVACASQFSRDGEEEKLVMVVENLSWNRVTFRAGYTNIRIGDCESFQKCRFDISPRHRQEGQVVISFQYFGDANRQLYSFVLPWDEDLGWAVTVRDQPQFTAIVPLRQTLEEPEF